MVDKTYFEDGQANHLTINNHSACPILKIERQYANKYNVAIDSRYPYLHVHRYSAKADGISDDSNSIQCAVDLAENFFSKDVNTTVTPITFESGVYVIKKSIKIKCYPGEFSTLRPIYFSGTASDLLQGINGSKCTQIKPLIPKQNDLGYASAFVINSVHNVDTDTDVCATGNGTPARMVTNVTFKNLAIQLGRGVDGTETPNDLNYDIIGIKTYNTRLSVENVVFEGLQYGVFQPRKAGQCNDMNVFKKILINKPKMGGLFLTYSDCCNIEQIQSHDYTSSTIDSLIDFKNGSSITIKNIHAAEFGSDDGTEFAPINLGSGATGTKALFKFDSLYGVNFESVYVERPFLDYVISLSNCENVKFVNYNERFVGNGFVRFAGRVYNVVLENIYRYGNILSEYHDFNFVNPTVYALKVKNFIAREYYTNTLTLTSDYRISKLARIPSTTYTFRDLKFNGLTRTMMVENGFEGEIIDVIVYFDTTWKVKRGTGKGITHITGTPTWDTNEVRLDTTKLPAQVIVSVDNAVNDGQSSFAPAILVQTNDKDAIRWYGTSNYITTPDVRTIAKVRLNIIGNIANLTR